MKARLFILCGNLTDVIMPNVTTIGEAAFEGCDDLINVTVSSKLTYVGNRAFRYTALENNYLDGVLYLGSVAYKYKGTDTDVEIREGITSIAAKFAFEDSTIVNLTIPESVTNIGESAFEYCDKLENVVMSKNITTIGSGAFANCTSLTSIIIWEKVTNLGYRTFYGWSDSQTINIEADQIPEGWDAKWNVNCDAKIVYAYTGV